MVKKLWKSLEEKERQLNEAGVRAEEPAGYSYGGGSHAEEQEQGLLDLLSGETVSSSSSRRDFFRLCGYSITAAALAASCKRPVQKAIPYLIQPEQIIPGKALHYASTYFDGHEYAPVVVKTRDGRPIKIEANTLAGFGGRGTTARVQASVLSLYDDSRYKQPSKNKTPLDWQVMDEEIIQVLGNISRGGGTIAIVSPSMISPATRAVLEQFIKSYPGTRLVICDPVSYSGMLEANMKIFGEALIPAYHFDKARLIVSFGADFLGTWLAPAHFISQYASGRTISADNPQMFRHIQMETGMTITGACADRRFSIKPSQEKALLASLYNHVAGSVGVSVYDIPAPPLDISGIASELVDHKGECLVVSGSNDPDTQLLVNAVNHLLGNYGRTIDLHQTIRLKQGIDEDMYSLVAEMNNGKTGAVIFINSNPVYDYPGNDALLKGLEKVGVKISLAACPDETSDICEYICPASHYLETWNDAEPVEGHLSLAQPVIRQLFNTRSVQDTLMKWAGMDGDFHGFLKSYWKENIFPQQDRFTDFAQFWNESLQSGYLQIEAGKDRPVHIDGELLMTVFRSLSGGTGVQGIELHLYESVQAGNGSHANNPWLMELPDPVSKVSWDNYAAVSPKMAAEMNLQTGDMVRINDRLELPVVIQPGQASGTVSVALGYGRAKGGKVAVGVGQNAWRLMKHANRRCYYLHDANIEKLDRQVDLALSQEHHSMEGREIIREATLEEYRKDPYAGNHAHLEHEMHHQTLYPEVHFDGYHWGMAIDLGKCTGCNACVIACQAENNIAVVGKDEVRRRRIMHWMRIDRYYSGGPDEPEVHFQPVLCQHCDNAPCENVCPVSATNHSNEGINQMSYNRCIGTKYCINNCPYRVRRFNWYAYVNNKEFDYHQNSKLGKMVLNPDVVVRQRGVVEKCSFCVQRIQEKKMQAKMEGRLLRDQEILPACAQACPAGAIVFGDLNDPESAVSKLMRNTRNYHLLEELHTLPSVGYLTKIRNV